MIFRLGRAKKGGAQGPGLFFIIPCMDNISVVDLRTVTFDVPPQEILSKDSVTVAVDAVVYYKIRDPMVAVCNVQDSAKSTRLLASTTLRNILGTKTLFCKYVRPFMIVVKFTHLCLITYVTRHIQNEAI